jgi:hypothetical protein
MSKSAIWTTALAALFCIASARAHHSISMFDLGKPLWVKGTVVGVERVNPHVLIRLEQRHDDGTVQHWTLEGPGLNSFTRMGWASDVLQAGHVIEVCGFGFKEEVLAQLSSRNTGAVRRPNFHGHILVMPNGQLRMFGGYGKTENCIRPGDEPQKWVSLLSTDSRARSVWCMQQVSASFPSVAAQELVDEVNRLLPDPCDG